MFIKYIYIFMVRECLYVCVKNASIVGWILHLTNDLMKDLAIMIVHYKKEKQGSIFIYIKWKINS